MSLILSYKTHSKGVTSYWQTFLIIIVQDQNQYLRDAMLRCVFLGPQDPKSPTEWGKSMITVYFKDFGAPDLMLNLCNN